MSFKTRPAAQLITRLMAQGLGSLLATGVVVGAMAASPPPKAKGKAAPPSRAAAAAPTNVLPEADDGQRTAASHAHFGDYACEFGERVKVLRNARHEGYVDVQHRQSTWTMKPIISSTGALRLEDVRGGVLMLQIASKSMLMDTRRGQRMVDNCVHDNQRHAPGPVPGEGLGIAPAGAVATAPS